MTTLNNSIYQQSSNSQMSSTKPDPRVILGVMNIGPTPSTGARISSLPIYISLLSTFASHGHNEIDTARTYVAGEQEAFTREAISSDPSLNLSIATKFYPFNAGDHSAAKLEEALDKSLSELRIDSIDIFYLHAADRSLPFSEPLRKCNEMFRQGKFKTLGLSNFTAYEIAEVVMLCIERGWVRPRIFQCMYNAITRGIEPELVATCRRYGLEIVVYNPLAGGIFSGKYKTSEEVPQEGRYSDQGPQGVAYRERYFKDGTFEALRIIEPVAQAHDLTLLEISFRWLVHHSALNIKDGGNDGIIIGVSSVAQLEANLKDIGKGPLPAEVVDALDRAWLVAKATAPNYWHGKLEYGYYFGET